MRRIAAEIEEQTRLTCSIGITENRMLAKITSELGKPAGLVVLSREQALERFGADSPGLVPGIGPKTVARLERMGIADLATLREYDLAALEAAFGPRMGGWLRARARFEDETPIARLAQDQVAVDRDDLRHRHRRPRAARRAHPEPGRGALPAAQLPRPRGPDDRDQGPPRRLDDRHPLPHRRARDQRPRRRRPRRARPAARLRPAPPRAPARRPDGGVRRGGGRAEQGPEPGQMQLGVSRLAQRLARTVPTPGKWSRSRVAVVRSKSRPAT